MKFYSLVKMVMRMCAQKRLMKKIDMTNFGPKNMLISHTGISLIIVNIFSIVIGLNTRDYKGKLPGYEKRTYFRYISYQDFVPILGPKCVLKTTIATDLRWLSLKRASKNMKLCHIAKVCRMNSFRYIVKTNLNPCTFSCKTANTH